MTIISESFLEQIVFNQIEDLTIFIFRDLLMLYWTLWSRYVGICHKTIKIKKKLHSRFDQTLTKDWRIDVSRCVGWPREGGTKNYINLWISKTRFLLFYIYLKIFFDNLKLKIFERYERTYKNFVTYCTWLTKL